MLGFGCNYYETTNASVTTMNSNCKQHVVYRERMLIKQRMRMRCSLVTSTVTHCNSTDQDQETFDALSIFRVSDATQSKCGSQNARPYEMDLGIHIECKNPTRRFYSPQTHGVHASIVNPVLCGIRVV